MKKIILLISIVISVITYSQISDVSDLAKELKCESVGKVGPMGVFMAEIEKCKDSVYRFTYKDFKFTKITEIKSFSFADQDGALEYLHSSLIKGFGDGPKDDITLKLPNDILTIKFEKSLGFSVVKFYHTDKYGVTGLSQSFTKKQIDKLFGKK